MKLTLLLLSLLNLNIYSFEKAWKKIFIHEDLDPLYYGVP